MDKKVEDLTELELAIAVDNVHTTKARCELELQIIRAEIQRRTQKETPGEKK